MDNGMGKANESEGKDILQNKNPIGYTLSFWPLTNNISNK